MGSYEEFEDKARVIANIGQINELLTWDQEVMMPEQGIDSRSQQKSVLSTLSHQKLVEEELGELINDLDQQELDSDQEAVLREISMERERAVKVPEELVQKISEKSSTCVDVWKKAREEDDFEMFAEELEGLVELKRKYAEHIDPDEEPYKVLFRDYEPYMDFETVETILERLKTELSELIDEIRQQDVDIDASVVEKELSEGQMMELAENLAEAIGYNFDRGRLDLSTHPFTTGNQFDARITTRFENGVLENTLITMHETGHALYQQGLPDEYYGTPLGQSRELSIHESQSRLWENHVGRSRKFWNYFTEELEELSDEFDDLDSEQAYRAVNRVKTDNMIRTQADEITYHLHIVLRFEIGRALINGDIEVDELPEVWNDKMEELLGVRPENDAEGVMQDIHWAWGNFGYFPTYSLGSVLAAQIYAAAEEEIENLDHKVENGEFEDLREWLRENVHGYGQRYTTEELIEEATGEKPTADHFLEYINSKYGELYGL